MIVKRLFIKPIFAWYDLWIGAFIDTQKRILYILPLPMVGVKIRLLPAAKFGKENLCRACGWVGAEWEKDEGITPEGYWGDRSFCPECDGMRFRAYYRPPDKLTEEEIPF